jgi:uncharacterized membrane protein YsdA (DUF1294 family)
MARDVREAALAVVGEQHGVVLRQQLFEGRTAGQHFVVRLVLEVHAQQLLLAADDAQLDGGLAARVAPRWA